MKFEPSILPWNGSSVRMSNDLYPYIADRLSERQTSYLPGSITLFVDPDIDDSAVTEFLDQMCIQLRQEFRRRESRVEKFVDLGLFSNNEMRSFLIARRNSQPWAIYYSKLGGLGPFQQDTLQHHGIRGVIPCSSMRNHGVAWSYSSNAVLEVWLATARKEGHDWNWDSDIGHESAHATFAQVPLFAQGIQKDFDAAVFSKIGSTHELSSAHLAKMAYLFSEIAVVAIRGESRSTETTLPVLDKSELYAMLRLSHDLTPHIGFEGALKACFRVKNWVDLIDSNEMFEIAAPIMRVIPYLTSLIRRFEPPALAWYQTVNPTCRTIKLIAEALEISYPNK
jgi:hypothetical protein